MSFYGPVRVFREFKLGGFWRTKSRQRDMEWELQLLELELNEGVRVWGEDASLKLCLPVSSRANINSSNSLSIQFSLIRLSVLQFHHPPNTGKVARNSVPIMQARSPSWGGGLAKVLLLNEHLGLLPSCDPTAFHWGHLSSSYLTEVCSTLLGSEVKLLVGSVGS